MDWLAFKALLEHLTGISRDALHLLAGVALQLVAAGLFRQSLGRVLPLLTVLAAALVNEWLDLTFDIWPNRQEQWIESIKDVSITMALPVLLIVLARSWPGLLVDRDKVQLLPEAAARPETAGADD